MRIDIAYLPLEIVHPICEVVECASFARWRITIMGLRQFTLCASHIVRMVEENITAYEE